MGLEDTVERTLVIVKPEAFVHGEEILAELDTAGTRVATSEVLFVPQEIIEAHYAVHQKKPFFEAMTQYFVGKSVFVSVYRGERVITDVRELIGATEPAKAAPHTIRARYGGNESVKLAHSEGRGYIKNVVHASDSPGEAEREISVWQEYLQIS